MRGGCGVSKLLGAGAMIKRVKDIAAKFPDRVGAALYQEAQIEMTEAKRRTPVDTGALRASGAVIPVGPGPYLSLIETGGSAPLRIHNVPGAHIQRPTGQVMVRGSSYQTTRAMAKAAYDALDGTFNTTLSGTFYQKITA